MGHPVPDFGVIQVPQRRWRIRVLLTLAIVFVLIPVLSGVVCCFAVTMVVIAAVKGLASIGAGLVANLCLIAGLCVMAAVCFVPFIIELISLLSTGQIVPFVVRLVGLLTSS
jgi:hypothetical protein